MSDPTQPVPDASTVPHCYRHPERETYISCQRCGKPICPDCMRDAAVGFQCPDCIKEGSVGMRQARTSFGGRLGRGPALVTYLIIAINVGVFIAARADGRDGTLVRVLALNTSIDFPSVHLEGVAQGSYWQLMSAAFLHVDPWHIGLNMLALYFVGPYLEQQLGRWRFVALYLISAFAGNVLYYLLSEPFSFDKPVSYALGASGAIFGLFAAQLLILHKQGRDYSQVLFFLAINIVATFASTGIAWQGHVGGFAAGLVLATAMAYAPRERRLAVTVAAMAGTTLLCLALVVLRTISLT